MSGHGAADEDLNKLARRFSDNDRIATPTLRRILRDIDDEMHSLADAGAAVPQAVRELRDVVARACLMREEAERQREDRQALPLDE